LYRYQDMHLELPTATPVVTPGIDRVYAYLRERGVAVEDIDRLGLHIVPAHQLIQRAKGSANMSDMRLAVVFPHIAVNGDPIDWWSSRLIDTGLHAVNAGFSALVGKKWGKMFCPPGEAPHAYLVPTLDWSKLQRGDSVYIHESCIKAINGAALGFWSVGLNGVNGWSSKKHEIALLPELRDLPWKDLELRPVIVFDSNVRDNWDVKHAVSSLAAKLLEITGRHAVHMPLPAREDGTHWGFDDYRVALGDDAAREYLEAAAQSDPVEVSDFERMRLRLNADVCVVKSLGVIAVQDSCVLMSRGVFCDLTYAHFIVRTEDATINVPRVWLGDPRRTEVDRIDYVPGGPSITREYLNSWKGMGAEPMPGDVSPWLELLEKQVKHEWLRKWMIQWFAYPLQNLGCKMNHFLHLYGPSGTGKNALLEPIKRIYGDNAVTVGKDQIISGFNSIYTSRQFVNLDELHGGTDPAALAITNRIKMLVTGKKIVVNPKGKIEYEIDNRVNLATTANYSDAVKLDDGDRRACVVKFGTRGEKLPDEWWDKYWAWEAQAAPALYEYLLRVDMEGFNPFGHAPHTEWKEIITDSTRGAMEKWVRDLWDDPDSALPKLLHGLQLLTPEQVGAAYTEDEPHKNTPGLRNALGQRMQDMGFAKVEAKVGGAKRRFWVVRNRDEDWTPERVRKALGEKLNSKF
jgi:hypothetical protein